MSLSDEARARKPPVVMREGREKGGPVSRMQWFKKRISASLGRLTVIKDEPAQEMNGETDGRPCGGQRSSAASLESRSLSCLVTYQTNGVEHNHDALSRSHNEVRLALRTRSESRSSPPDSPFGKMNSYKKLEQLGEGSYATVFKGMSK
ncbi:PREDICTED: cyclin-dependent kinase 14-like [Priapulus caudatus]|uniref:Cyclin-dependent kinase 14-like n=1 Tax=Priapulus caudatus TaxID=37621 RepID=A0ABM1DTA1_PRICU|nr:PREDICTED: cyclin-dependent kinase 14-like [Priapulus caudatus]